jgi:hypothetical protein
MSANVIPFRPAEFVNIHGKPLPLTMQRLVQQLVPEAQCERYTPQVDKSRTAHDRHHIMVLHEGERVCIGSGGSEEAAWRDAYFHLKEET